jgi:hypothetical protein
MFMCEIQEWMGLIMLEWKVFFQCDGKFLHTHVVKATAKERNLANCQVCSIEYHVCCLHSSFC